MSFNYLYQDALPPTRAALEEDTYFLAQIIFGHLVTFFSTPNTLATWDEDIAFRMHNFFLRTFTSHRDLRPSTAIRALLLILRFRGDNNRLNLLAYNDDAEVLFYSAFMRIAGLTKLAFRNPGTMLDLIQAEEGSLLEAKFWDNFTTLDEQVPTQCGPWKASVEDETLLFLEFWFAPFVSKNVRRSIAVRSCPQMFDDSPYGGYDWSGRRERVFPINPGDDDGSSTGDPFDESDSYETLPKAGKFKKCVALWESAKARVAISSLLVKVGIMRKAPSVTPIAPQMRAFV